MEKAQKKKRIQCFLNRQREAMKLLKIIRTHKVSGKDERKTISVSSLPVTPPSSGHCSEKMIPKKILSIRQSGTMPVGKR